MFAAIELSQAVRERRSDMGLTQAVVSKLSGLSRATVSQIENATIRDLRLTRAARLLNVLGLTLTVTPARPRPPSTRPEKTPALTLAAQTASVSYKDALTPDMLRDVLMRGDVDSAFIPHLTTLLEDAPVVLLASVVEQLHETSGVERAAVWSTMRALALRLSSVREIWG